MEIFHFKNDNTSRGGEGVVQFISYSRLYRVGIIKNVVMRTRGPARAGQVLVPKIGDFESMYFWMIFW